MSDATWPRLVGAAAVIAGGALHLRLALDDYGNDDLITLFFLNAIGSALVAAWLAYDRRPLPLLAGLGLSVMSLLAFAMSRVGDGVVGFRGVGLEPAPDAVLTVGVEAIAVVVLAVAAVGARDELIRTLRPTRA